MVSLAEKVVDSPVLPARKERIQALDAIRGLAILGVLAVNADGFAVPQAASLKPSTWPFPNQGLTAFSYWAMDTFFHDKFLTIFSMLFGVSLFLVGGDGSDARKNRLLIRRLAVLFCFGMLHGFGIWWGDILSLYAVTGLLMFFCRRWAPKSLLVVGAFLYAVMAGKELLLTALPPEWPLAQAVSTHSRANESSQIGQRKAQVDVDMQAAKSSSRAAYALNAREYRRVLSGDFWLIPQTLGLMMIGLSLFRSGFLAGRSSARRYAIANMVGVSALGITGILCYRQDVLSLRTLHGGSLLLVLAPFVSLAYAGSVILTLRAKAAWILSPLAATGRMAFTNYLTQSLIMTSIFYGGRGALMGQVDRPELWVIVGAIWTLQLAWSPLWLATFEMGPLEWVWRSLTVGRVLPLLKDR